MDKRKADPTWIIVSSHLAGYLLLTIVFSGVLAVLASGN